MNYGFGRGGKPRIKVSQSNTSICIHELFSGRGRGNGTCRARGEGVGGGVVMEWLKLSERGEQEACNQHLRVHGPNTDNISDKVPKLAQRDIAVNVKVLKKRDGPENGQRRKEGRTYGRYGKSRERADERTL